MTTLILGGTGKTGKRVAQRLGALGIDHRIASRASGFEWHDRATYRAALEGMKALYIAYAPDLAVPGAAEQIGALAALAVERGVERIVLLSGRGEAGARVSEAAARASAPAVTILRAAWFAQNFSEGFLVEGVLAGEIAFPAGAVAEPFVDADDIADVAVAALTTDDHRGQTYALTGPRLLTFAAVAAILGEVTARSISYLPVSLADYEIALAEHLPAEHAAFLCRLFAETLDGHNAYVEDGVERVLGRRPREFVEFAREAFRR